MSAFIATNIFERAWAKLVDFAQDATATDWALLGILVLIPILVGIILIVAIVKFARRKSTQYEILPEEQLVRDEVTPEQPEKQEDILQPIQPQQDPMAQPIQPQLQNNNNNMVPPCMQQRQCIQLQQPPQIIQTRVIERVTAPTPEQRTKVKVRLVNLKKADKYLLLSTGIFCIGLGAMIQRIMTGNNK